MNLFPSELLHLRIYLIPVLQKPVSGRLGLNKKAIFLCQGIESIQQQVSSNQAITDIYFNIARICLIGQRMNGAEKGKQEGSP